MSSVMPNVPPSPPIRRVDSSDALKTQVVLQDLTITASNMTPTPVKLQRPVPTAERRDREYSFDRDPDAQAASRKRTNSTQVVSPMSPKRRSGDAAPSSAVVEGELSVVEQIEHNDAPSIRRSFGKIHCRLSRQNRAWCLYSVSHEEEAPLRLHVDHMSLVHDPLLHELNFALQSRGGSENARTTSFLFAASSADECTRWVSELREVMSGKVHASPSSNQSNAHARLQAKETVAGPSIHAARPAKRGGLVYTIPPKITHIVLVRHGHYVNAHAKGVSDSDQVLSQMGRQQAELTGKYLEKLYHRCPARNQQLTLYHSDLTRAVETASVVSKNITLAPSPVASSLLREGWPGQPFATDQMPRHMLKPRGDGDDDLDRQDMERMDEAYKKYFAENVDDDECSFRVIVCHANLIRYFLCRALRVEPDGVWGHFEINHCGVTRIDLCRNRPLKVMAINETGHLPHSLTTSSEDHL